MFIQLKVLTHHVTGISGYAGDTTFRVDNAKGLPENWKSQVKENNQHGTGDADGGGFNASLISNVAIVNGQLNPEISMTSGRWQRWQILNAVSPFQMHKCIVTIGSLVELTHLSRHPTR